MGLFFSKRGRLLGDKRLLQSAQQLLGFGQRQAEIFGVQLASLQNTNLLH